jgi:hypothetical protein
VLITSLSALLQDTGDNSIINAGGIAGGTETLDNGTLSIGSTAGSHLIDYDPDGVGATLVLGPHLIIDQTGMAQIASSQATTAIDDEVVSFTTISTSAGSTFFIQPDFFTNHGDINADPARRRARHHPDRCVHGFRHRRGVGRTDRGDRKRRFQRHPAGSCDQ